jgi:phage terminase large subunit
VLYGKWTVEEFTPGADWDGPYFGVDWGTIDPTCAVRVWLHRDSLYIEHEVYASGADDVVKLLRGLPGLDTHVSHADNAWPETIQHVRRSGFQRMIAVQKWPGSVDDGVRWLRGRDRIVIHPRCKNTHREAGLWRYKTDKAENVLPDLQSGNDHAWDAIRYAVVQHIRSRKGSIETG